MWIAIFLALIFIACFASLMTGGLWSNTITLVNVITSALLATNYFEPLANLFDKQEPSYTYIWDFLALWGIFAVSMTILRVATDYVSQVKVKFFMPVEKAGGYIMAIWASWIVLCFATMTLHTAPLSRNFMGFQSEPSTRMLFGLAPDRLWLAWVWRESRGTLCGLRAIVEFDPQHDFILRYASRRDEFDKQITLGKAGGGGMPVDAPK